MRNRATENELDLTPLVNALVEKTKAGKLKWEETLEENAFIASVGGNTTFKVQRKPDGHTLSLFDEKGTLVWDTQQPWLLLEQLFGLARRVALKVDERVDALMETLQKL